MAMTKEQLRKAGDEVHDRVMEAMDAVMGHVTVEDLPNRDMRAEFAMAQAAHAGLMRLNIESLAIAGILSVPLAKAMIAAATAYTDALRAAVEQTARGDGNEVDLDEVDNILFADNGVRH